MSYPLAVTLASAMRIFDHPACVGGGYHAVPKHRQEYACIGTFLFAKWLDLHPPVSHPHPFLRCDRHPMGATAGIFFVGDRGVAYVDGVFEEIAEGEDRGVGR